MRLIFRALIVVASFLVLASAWAFDPFVVRDIRIEGVQRTEPGTVFSYLPVKVGEEFTEEKAQQAIRALFATGFFRDVRLEVDNGVLIVALDERPAIAQIDFSGMKEFEPAGIRKSLREVGLAESRIFDRALLEQAEQEMKRQYLSRGRYAVQIQTTVTPLERNRVGISFAVTEGDVAKIRGVNIVGATAFREKELLDEIVLRTPGWLTWYTKHDQYSRQRLAGDLETLRAYYQNRGYLDFNIDSTQVSITPDKKDIYITININEGERYTIGQVDVAGQMLIPEGDLKPLITFKTGEVFSRQKLVETTKAIADRLGNEGYAFANANAIPQIDREKRIVSFTIMIDPGRRVYVRRINVNGNTKTRDEVVRREMRQLEGAFYDASKIQLSKKRVDRTGYFKDVNVETTAVDGVADQVDVSIKVEEKPTGSIMAGVGFSSVDKVVLQGSISQSNIFGSGKFVSLAANTGRVNTTYALSYTDPYYTVDGMSRGFDLYKRKFDASSLSTGAYKTDSLGGGMRWGYPIDEKTGLGFGFGVEKATLDTYDSSPTRYKTFVSNYGNDYSYGTLNASLGRDTRDSAILTTDGVVQRVYSEVAAGDLQFYRVGYIHQYFRPLSRTFTLGLSGNVGIAHGINGKPLPFFKSYYAGGPGSVRGYMSSSLGPQDSSGNVMGGSKSFTGSAEVKFPVPGASQDKSLQLSTFIDAGQVYAEGQTMAPSDLRYAAGMAFSWSSPFGPLKLSYANPLNKKDGDRVQRLQFTFGTSF